MQLPVFLWCHAQMKMSEDDGELNRLQTLSVDGRDRSNVY
jgi:hypothetical protein